MTLDWYVEGQAAALGSGHYDPLEIQDFRSRGLSESQRMFMLGYLSVLQAITQYVGGLPISDDHWDDYNFLTRCESFFARWNIAGVKNATPERVKEVLSLVDREHGSRYK